MHCLLQNCLQLTSRQLGGLARIALDTFAELRLLQAEIDCIVEHVDQVASDPPI